MIRSVAAILAALNSVAPNFPHKEAAAVYVQRLADEGEFDPYTMLAYVESESGWRVDAINRQGGELYLGLGQLRLRNYEACREDFEAPECLVIVEALQNWRFNLDQTAQAFVWARGRCRELVGTGALSAWMQTVKGYDKTQRSTCGRRHGRPLPVPDAVAKLLKRRAQLAARF